MNLFKQLFQNRSSKSDNAPETGIEAAPKSANSNAQEVSSDWTVCPKCGSTNIGGSGGSNDYGVTWEVSCLDCYYLLGSSEEN